MTPTLSIPASDAMTLDPTIVVAAIAVFGSAVSIILTNRYAARSARSAQENAERQKAMQIDSESFKRARENYDAAIAEQERRIARLRTEIEQDREEFRHDREECNHRIDLLQRDIQALGEWARPLLRAAREAGVRHPNPPIWLDGTEEG
jgi:predicted RNase H-like nuclease (RuvC/YqgF family)